MQAIYHTTTNELTIEFIEMLKKQFLGAKVDIVIKEKDETDYLNSSPINKQQLEQALNEIKNGSFVCKTSKDLNL